MKITGTLCQLGNIFVVAVPDQVLQGRRYIQLRVILNALSCITKAFRLSTGEAVVVIPDSIFKTTVLSIGNDVEIEVAVLSPRRAERLPKDLEAALSQARTDLSVLQPFERHQFLSLVKESQTNAVRRKRIEAVVEACLKKGSLQH